MLRTIKELSGHYLAYAFGSVLTKGFGVILVPLLTYFLSPEEYGILGIVDLVSSFLINLSFGVLASVVVRFYFNFDLEIERSKFYGTLWIALLVVGVLFVIGMELKGEEIFRILFDIVPYHPYGRYSVWTAVVIVLSSGVPLHFLRASKESRKYVSLNSGSFILKFVLIVIFLVIAKDGLLGVLKGRLWGAVIAAIPFMMIMRRKIKISWSWDSILSVVMFSWPLLVHGFSSWGLNFVDRAILINYVSLEQLGLYTFGYQFGIIMSVFVEALNGSFTPYFQANADDPNRADELSILATYAWGTISVIGLSIVVLSEPVTKLIFPASYHAAVNVIPWVILGFVARGLYLIPANVLLYRKETHFMALGNIIGLVVNVVLNLLLVPRFGIIAAAFNTFVAYWVMLIIVQARALRLSVMNFQKTRILKIFLVCIVIFFIGKSIGSPSVYFLILIKSMLIACVPVGLWLVGFFSKKEIGVAYRITKNILQKAS